MKKIIIIGFMGSGKTTFGRMLAKELQLPFYDMDTEIEKKIGLEIPEIFLKYGEPFFRKVEKEYFMNWKSYGVLSCGGGVFDSIENRYHLQSLHSFNIWLHTDFETLYQRIENSQRPLVKTHSKDELYHLWMKRNEIFSALTKNVIENWSFDNFSVVIEKLNLFKKCKD